MLVQTPKPPPIPSQDPTFPPLPRGCYYGPPEIYVEGSEAAQSLTVSKAQTRAAWLQRMTTTRKIVEVEPVIESWRGVPPSNRPFVQYGAKNRTHKRLFSLYPNLPESVPPSSSSSSSSTQSTTRVPEPGIHYAHTGVHATSHDGLSSSRQRSWPTHMHGAGIPQGNQKLDLTKDYEWMPTGYDEYKYPHNSRGVYSYRPTDGPYDENKNKNKAFRLGYNKRELFEKRFPYTGASASPSATTSTDTNDKPAVCSRGLPLHTIHGDERPFITASIPLKATDYRMICGKLPNYRDEDLLARMRQSAIDAHAEAVEERLRRQRLKAWRDPRPISPLVGDDTSRRRQETVWSEDRTCYHNTQERIAATNKAKGSTTIGNETSIRPLTAPIGTTTASVYSLVAGK